MRFKLLILGLLAYGSTMAQSDEARKEINKSYQVSNDALLSIKNSFGEIHIENWDRNEFKVDIEILVEGSSEKRVQSLLSSIDVRIRESSGEYSFETNIPDSKGRNREQIEVNYSVKMPASNPIRINNSFGHVYLDDRVGEADVKVSYGHLKAKNFEAPLELRVSFGKGYIGKANEADAVIKYSDFEADAVGVFDLSQSYSNVEIEQVGTLDLVSKYGGVEIGEAGAIDADVGFSKFRIDKLSQSLDLEGSYISGFSIDELASDFEFVYIQGKYSSYEINLSPNTHAKIEGKFSYSNIKSYGAEVDFHYKVQEHNRTEYRGKIGNGDDNRKIIISSSYGDLKLRGN